MSATALEQIALLREQLARLQGESTSATRGPAAAATMLASTSKSPGTTPAASRRLKQEFKVEIVNHPTRSFRGHYGRSKTGTSYSHHKEEKVVVFVREAAERDPMIFGNTSVDIILARDSEDKVVAQWSRYYANVRSKFNETVMAVWKDGDMCTRCLGIREGETDAGAMEERLIEVATMVRRGIKTVGRVVTDSLSV
jgi:hypothetical protein